ncbi:ATP-binding protein [Parapedobacter sp. SGR-10]|uniref:AAA family ATPase n=1 Tax=Parapedobacter sp. SGR-10 TaxID=2710879 RepID=UPI0013D2A205|nr:ATP-binding protein [Parapedobacter sp. SGR-10]NGF54904.1 ATP-binding protein [Parapedobacter sp. SGR-10]
MNIRENKRGILKIAVVGPESTGKSTMAKYLGEQLGTVCVPEYARYYCRNLRNQYTLQDEVNMFYGQLALEEALIPLAKNNILICDVTIMTIKIWCDHLFGDTPQEVKDEIRNRKYDHYLLMDIDLPWEDDPLRDFPGQQAHFLEIWKKELKAIEANYTMISGLEKERLENGLKAIKVLSACSR